MSYLYDVIKKTPDIMPIKYRLVLRKDMTKGAAAGSKLYYAVNKSTGTCDFEELCDRSPTAAPPPGATCRSW